MEIINLDSNAEVVLINLIPGILTLINANTTIGYCRYNESGEIEYIFISSRYRRKGYAKKMLFILEDHLRCELSFQAPISPLGMQLKNYYDSRLK